jgi:G3E family GTPase
LLLNKIDLVEPEQIEPLETKLRQINPTAAIVRTERCRTDPELLFGIGRDRKIAPPEHRHQPEFESFAFISVKIFSRDCFERFANGLPASVIRAKGFSCSPIALSFSISWRAVGNWSHLNPIARNWCLSEETSLRKKRRSSARLVNAL